jgi:hypothetical protein
MIVRLHEKDSKGGSDDPGESRNDRRLPGRPSNGKPVTYGAKMVKTHWTPKDKEFFPDLTVRNVRGRIRNERGNRGPNGAAAFRSASWPISRRH